MGATVGGKNLLSDSYLLEKIEFGYISPSFCLIYDDTCMVCAQLFMILNWICCYKSLQVDDRIEH